MEKINEFRSSSLMYDIFGYLLPGFFFICLLIIDFDFGAILTYYHEHSNSLSTLTHGVIKYKMSYLFQFLTWNSVSDFKFTTLIMLVMFCYLLGHIIGAFSGWVIERYFNKRMLGFASESLLDKSERSCFKKFFFDAYTKPFDADFIDSFNSVFEKRFGVVKDKSAYFWLCFAELASKHPTGYNRVLHFLSLYGFSRNVSACFSMYIVLRLAVTCLLGIHINWFNGGILFIYFIISFVMYKNYLKLFYRQCAELYYHFYTISTNLEKQKEAEKSI